MTVIVARRFATPHGNALRAQFYQWTFPSGQTIYWDTYAIQAYCERGVPVQEVYVAALMDSINLLGHNYDFAYAMTTDFSRPIQLIQPFARSRDFIITDGHHRLWKASIRQRESIPAYCLPHSIETRFRITQADYDAAQAMFTDILR